jgi:hypothetical protein
MQQKCFFLPNKISQLIQNTTFKITIFCFLAYNFVFKFGCKIVFVMSFYAPF